MKSFRIDQPYLYAVGRAKMELKTMEIYVKLPLLITQAIKQPPKS